MRKYRLKETVSLPFVFKTVMEKSKRILLITPILFIFFAFGCSKNLLSLYTAKSDSMSLEREDSLEGIEENAGKRDFGSEKRGMPGNGSTGSFSAEPFREEGSGKRTGSGPEPDSEFFSEENVGPHDFGSEKRGMPGNGSTGSFSAGPFREEGGGEKTGSGPETDSEFSSEENVGSHDFGSAERGMPGNGSTGSAKPFREEGGGKRTGSGPEPDSEFFSEENVGPHDFGSAERGMPGNGSTGSFSAGPFREEGNKDEIPDSAEPFPSGKGADVVASLPQEDEVLRRSLPYSSSDHLMDVHFAFDRSALDDKSKAILEKNAAYLKSHPNSNIEIQGHCDERGSNIYNISLGERRTQSTKSYLVFMGVDENRIHTISYGEERPFCLESNENCWHENRRAHFLVAR